MAETIYNKIAKQVGKDVRLVRAAAHHPFEFFSERVADIVDHRPMRFRYLGVFSVKPRWHKGLKSSKKTGLPPNNSMIWARVPEKLGVKVYPSLKFGFVINDTFTSSDGNVSCATDEVLFWCTLKT